MQIGETFQSKEPQQPTNHMGDIIKVNQVMEREVGFEFIYGWAGSGSISKAEIEKNYVPISADQIRRHMPNYK